MDAARDNSSESGIRWWLLLWCAIGTPLLICVSTSWLECVLAMEPSEAIVPIAALMVLTFGIFKYVRTTPKLLLKWDVGGLLLLFGMASLNTFSTYFHFSRLFWLSFVGMLAGTIWTIAGKQYFKHWLPIFLFSMAAIPGTPVSTETWVSTNLQLLSANIATTIAALFVPITSSGTIFYVRDTAFEVAPACSGLPMLSNLLLFVLFWNLLKPSKFMQLILLSLLAAIIALVLNGLRLAIMALVAYWYSADTALAIHTNIEYLFLPLALLVLWKTRRRLSA